MPKSNQTEEVLPSEGGAIDDGDTARAAGSSKEGEAVASSTRMDRIRLAAYLAAQRRGFEPGYEESDWLQAERDVDAQAQDGPGDDELSSKPS